MMVPSGRFRSWPALLPLMLLLLLVAGCAGWRPVRDVELEQPPGEFQSELPADLAGVETDRWWKAFDDPTLDALIDSAFHHNLTFAQMLARHQQARASLNIARGSWFPGVNGSASYQEQGYLEGEGTNPFAGGNYNPAAQFAIEELWNVGLTATYELDLWGKYHANRQGALATFRASEEDLRAYTLSLSALVSRAWYGAVTLRRQQQLIDSTLTTYSNNLKLIEERYMRGVATSSDLYQARTTLAGARADAETNSAQLASAEHALSILMADYPRTGWTDGNFTLPSEVPDVAPALPSELVQRRPDVRAEYQRLVAADRAAAEAVAGLFPSFSLTGQLSGRSVELQDALDPKSIVWSGIGSVSVPIFNGGKLWNASRAAEAGWKAQVAAYKMAVLTAFQEVEDALVNNARLEEALRHRQDQANAARASLRVATDNYLRGVTNYLPVTIAQSAYIGAERAMIQARYSLLDARISLATALGASWMDDVLASVELNGDGDLIEVTE
ncbi:efflux transporter outer membrane subunit [bacterium]|nr:efflux transporter outer membrane subunit [bacterium]